MASLTVSTLWSFPMHRRKIISRAKLMACVVGLMKMLGKYFGGVPLLTREMTEAEIRKVARSTQEQTFAQAVSDYKQAISLLPSSWSSDNAGRMTRGAANAVLGRLYMFMKQPAEARPYLEAVINSGIYQLADSYEKIFNDAYDNDPSADRVWEVQYIGGMMGEGRTIAR